MSRQAPVPISGLWMRRIGDSMEMLAEVDGRWLLVCSELLDGSPSHIVEPSGILGSPVDRVTP